MSKKLSGGVRRWAALLTSVALLAQLISFAPPAIAAAPAPREIAELRSARGRIFDNGDGTYKYEAFSEAIHYQDTPGGGWKSIDSTLVRETNPTRKGWRNKANAFTVSLPEAVGAEWVSIEATAGVVKYRPAMAAVPLAGQPSTSATGTVDPLKPKEAAYKGAFGQGVDLEYVSTSDGLKETIVLDRYRGKNVFTFDLETGALTPRLTGDGGVGLYSAESTVPVYLITPPFMEDSSTNDGAEPATSYDVRYVLVPKAGAWQLSVVADTGWLEASERVWPVKIDPCIIYQPFGTFENNGYSMHGDAFVTNAAPTTNYGNSWSDGHAQLRVGYYPGAGENYSYVMPDINPLLQLNTYARVQVSFAYLNMNCWWRYDHGTGPIYYGPIANSWGEYSLTWNNQPYGAYGIGAGDATEGQRTRFPITDVTQSWINGTPAHGITFWAPEAGNVWRWTKFDAREGGAYPVFECCFTTRPVAQCAVPSDPETPFADAPTVQWAYSDLQYQDGSGGWHDFIKPLVRTEVQVKGAGASDSTITNGSIAGPGVATRDWQQGAVPTPSGGWQDGAYETRVRVVTYVAELGMEVVSDWTAWSTFSYRALAHGADGLGIEPYRAQDSAGGATVDLATGRLLLSRTDFAATALGGALGASFVYDSAVTTDTSGAGTGWRVSMPSLGFDDQAAPNPGFEEGSGTACPTGWTPLDSAYVSRSSTYRDGSYSLKLSRPAGSYGTAVAYSSATPLTALSVVPGQRVDVSAWARTVGVSRYSAAGGVFAQIAYFDGSGTYLSADSSSVLIEANTPAGVGWRNVAVASVAPANARKAQLGLAMTNSCGTVYFDDVYFATGAMRLTDADGTSRPLAQTGGGAYMRDPLAGTLAFKRTNVARGIVPTLVGTGGVTGASTDGSYAITTSSGYDYVYNGTNTSFTYNLGEAKVLSEARLFLWDGAAAGETTPREHTYKLQYSTGNAAGPYVDLTSTITGARSWQTHYFTPVKAQYFRVVTIDSTSGAFVLCELELPVTTLSESPVAFDANRRVTGIADTSGNIITYTYDTDSDLLSSADSQGRHVDLTWSGEQLSGVNWAGVGSESTTPVTESGVVSYLRDSSNLLVRRKADDGTYVTMATYAYTSGRITSVTDADGVSAQVAYDTNGRVSTITRSSESTPTVTTYDYSVANQVTITTTGGDDSVSRRVEFDPALGCQVTKVVVDPGGEDLTTTYAYDSYGHVKSVTDPLGRIDTYKSDAHGNVTEAVVNSTAATDDLKLTTTATYTNDRVASTTDAKGNQSFSRYDAKWRPVSLTVAIANSVAAGSSSTEETYDDWGNTVRGELPGSSVASLLKNGTFETNVLLGGTGWTLYGDVRCVAAPYEQTNLGYLMVKGGDGTPWVESSQVSVTEGETYIASAWSTAGGHIGLSEYNAAGQWQRRITLASPPAGDGVTLMPVSALYIPSAGVASVRFEIGLEGNAAYDNARFEKAYAAGPDSFIDNDSAERLTPAGVPESWDPHYIAGTVVDSVVLGDERALRLSAGSLGTYGWWESAQAPVTAGRPQRFTTNVASDALTQGSGGWAGVEVIFFPDYGCTWGTETRFKLTGSPSIAGTSGWTPYSAVIQVPANAHWVKICPQIGNSTGAMYVDHLTMEPVTARETYAHDATHTYRTETTKLSGAKVGAEYDSRGRTVEVTHTNPGSTSETVETARTYDGFDRLTRAETAPGSPIDDIVAEFTYTPAGRLETVTDPLGRTTTITYDEGRIAGVTTPSGITTSMTYDGLGRLATTTAPYRTGQSARTLLEYVYDAVGRIASTTYYAEDGSVAATQTATYDDLSRPDVVTWSGPEAQGSLDYTYDALGRTTALASTGPAGTVNLTSTYDKASLPLTTSFTAFGLPAFTITNIFAKTGQWQKTSTANSQEWAFTFGSDGTFRRASSALSSRGLVYNTALQLDRVRLATTSGLFTAEEALTYDGYGRVAGSTMAATGVALDAASIYTYDAAGRLSTWTLDGATTTYTHDAAGNLIGIDALGTADDATFTASEDNSLTTATTGGATTTYTHDDFGRRTHESSTETSSTYTWNSLGQLASVASDDATSTYSYGPTGMRERVVVESAEGTTTSDAVWAGGRLLAERDSDGTLYRYLYGPSGLPLEMIVTPEGGTPASYAYQCDRAGSVIALTDESGTVVASYSYDPWGRLLSTGGSDSALTEANPLRYRGYHYDTQTGHYYLPARYYDPGVARFLSPDPAAPSAGDPLTLNRYAYCVGDPVNASDPSGAIMDSDGNGKADVWDMRYHRSKTSGTRYQRLTWGAKARTSYYSATGNAGAYGIAQKELRALEFAGEFGPGSVMMAKVVGQDFSDANATGRHLTGGMMSSYTRYDDGAVITKRYLYIGGSSSRKPGVSRLAGDGDVSPGFYLEGGRTIGCVGAAGYIGASHGVQSGLATPSALAVSAYFVLPFVIDEHIDGRTANTSYGGDYLY